MDTLVVFQPFILQGLLLFNFGGVTCYLGTLRRGTTVDGYPLRISGGPVQICFTASQSNIGHLPIK